MDRRIESFISYLFTPFRYVQKSFSKKKVILCYHSIHDDKNRRAKGYVGFRNSISVEEFRKQIAWLKKFVEFSSIDKMLSSDSKEKWEVGITFDDGYRNNLTLAYPILKEFNIPFTIFVCSDFVKKNVLPWWDLIDFILENELNTEFHIDGRSFAINTDRYEKVVNLLLRSGLKKRNAVVAKITEQLQYLPQGAFLNKEELLEISKDPLVTIGGHSKTHVNLKQCNSDELKKEIIEDREALAEIVGNFPDHFALPFGKDDFFDDQVVNTIKRAGYESFSTSNIDCLNGIKNDIVEIPRILIYNDWNLNIFKNRILNLFFYKLLK